MLVREVRAEEYDEAGRVVVAAYAALPGDHMTPGYAAELADVARRAAEADVLVAVDQGEGAGGGEEEIILGCVTFVPDCSSPWAELLEEEESAIRMLAVGPAFQGHGVGKALLDGCIERARKLGSRSLVLHTTPWMPAARHLYEQAGFVRIPQRDWKPEPDVPLLAFRLALE